MQVTIKRNNKTGTVEWSEESFDGAVVGFPEQGVIDQVNEFLDTPRTFRIPQSQRIDDFKEVTARPNDGLDFMELGLSELYANTGIFVEWPEEQ